MPNNNYKKIFLYLGLFLIPLFTFPSLSKAAIDFTDGKWETTFDCNLQSAITGEPTNICDGLDAYGYSAETDAIPSSITITSNNSFGVGGLGFRHNMHSGDRNDHSVAMRATFSVPQTELWVRWYQRTLSGSAWTGLYSNKVIYFRSDTMPWFYFMVPYTPGTALDYDTTGWGFNGHSDDYPLLRNNDGGWTSTQGGLSSDGEWDCYEVYVKANDIQDLANGILRTWINGVLVHTTNYDFLGHSTAGSGVIAGIDIGQNHDIAYHPTDQDVWEDYDDIMIATPGYAGFVQDADNNPFIGPIGWANADDTVPPNSPSGLLVL